MKQIKFFFIMLLSLIGISQAQAQETLTVYDGTATNQCVPINGYYADYFQKCEFIIPAAKLSSMDGAEITEMEFYTQTAAVDFSKKNFQIYLNEVESTTLSDYLGVEGATLVYEGGITVIANKAKITFASSYNYSGGNLQIAFVLTTKTSGYTSCTFLGETQSENTAIYGYNSGSLANVNKNTVKFLPKTTFTYEAKAEGPAFRVKGLKNGETLDFGLIGANAEQAITLTNPGTEAVNVAIATEGGFTAPASVTIEAKSEQTITVAAPDALGTSNGKITFTPEAEGLEAVGINLSATVKDPAKMFVDFAENALPEDWTTQGIGSYTIGNYGSSCVWNFSEGYAQYKSSSNYGFDGYKHSLVSPFMKFDKGGEKLFFKMKKDVTSASYESNILVQYTTDGQSWTDTPEGAFANAVFTTDWKTVSVTIPENAVKIRFVAVGVGIDDIYGGQLSTDPVMSVVASDMSFGMIEAEKSATFTIKNIGKSTLEGIEVNSSSDMFIVTNAPTTIDSKSEAEVTVTMSVANTGAQAGTITVSAPDQTTVTFDVSGYVMDNTLFTETFDDNKLPERWENTGWTFANGEATGSYRSTMYQLNTPALVVAEGEVMAIEAAKTRASGSCTLPIYVSKNGGEYTLLKNISNDELEYDKYKVFFIEGLEPGSYSISFRGNDAKINAVNGFHLDMNAPIFAMESTEKADFGKLTSSASKTYKVSNKGTGELVVNIASTSEEFTIEPAQLVITDEAKEFTVTYNYTTGNYGKKDAVITVTPTYNEDLAIAIAASAKPIDPEAWDEDFEGGAIPLGWEDNGWSVGKFSYTTNPNATYLALGTKNGTLITPRLEAKTGDVLMWETYMDWADESMIVEYSADDKQTWTQIYDYTPQAENANAGRGTMKDMSFTAPADGYYYLRFTTTYQNNGVDNFNGFRLALKEHDAVISEQSIPTSGNQYSEYTARVTVKDMSGNDDTFTAKFFIGETQYGEEVVETIEAGSTKEFVVKFTPEEAISGDAYFVVSNDYINIEGEKVAVSIKAAVVLDEAEAIETMPSGYQNVVQIKYTAKAGWNTICVPFALSTTDLNAIFGEGYKAYELKGYTDGALKFGTSSRCYAGYPYIVYSAQPVANENGYIVKSVNFSATTAKYDSYNGATCQGTYDPIPAPDMEGLYGVVPSTGRIQKGSATASLKGYRAYFELPADADAESLSLEFDDGTVITAIEAIENGLLNSKDAIYDLNGRKMNANELLPAGVYIQNGKKIIVK